MWRKGAKTVKRRSSIKQEVLNAIACPVIIQAPGGPDIWRRGGPTTYGSATTRKSTRFKNPARNKAARCTGTSSQPRPPNLKAGHRDPAPKAPTRRTHKKPSPGTHQSLAYTPRAPKQPALTVLGSRPRAPNTARQGTDTRLLAPPDRRNCARPHTIVLAGTDNRLLAPPDRRNCARRVTLRTARAQLQQDRSCIHALPVKKKKTARRNTGQPGYHRTQEQ
ncbi:hypothetical protein NDU88_003540 [Pleurodeles waltl]|uniref:Uncharacterized protein n=1 Tax=Pleurodeles waltl TaxID=8319 RepID=A0AAV7T541_PLEWA|nr:hypothetical protein NDU88_003540 [Pleurodeles waltl]